MRGPRVTRAGWNCRGWRGTWAGLWCRDLKVQEEACCVKGGGDLQVQEEACCVMDGGNLHVHSDGDLNVQEESFGVKIGGDLYVHSDGDLFKRKLVV